MKRCKTIPAVLAISLLALTAWALTGPGGSGDPSPVNRSSRGVPETVSTNREVYTTPDIAPLIPKDLTITLTGDGAGIGSTILCGQPFNFTIWLYNRTDENISEFDLGFRLYSPEGATWAVPTLGLNPELLLTYFGPDVFPYLGSLDGSGADTIGLEAGYGDLGPGLPPDFVGYLWTITTELDCADTGATYCIDSCWFPPSGNWHWNLGGGGSTNPKWGGPYCFALQVGGSFCDTIYFQYDADSPDTVHFATNIERPDSVYVRFQPFVHVLPPQTPITILYDDEESGYQFEVGDIDLINHELTYEDTLMWKLPEGEHLYQANLGDIVTCERLFATEDKPLADAWFAHSDASFDTLGEFYDINSIVPQWSAPYLYRDTFTLFQRLMENRLSYDVYIYQDFNLDGSQDITLDDTIRFILFGASVLSTDAGVSVWEEEDPRVFNFASPVVGLTTSPLKLFEGVWVQFTVGGDILSVTVGGTIKHTDGSWTVDGTLYAPPEPFWGRLDFVSELEIAAKAFGEIKILAGLASAKVDITSDFRYDIATGISRGPDTLEINTELCRIFKLDWKATLKFLWKTKKYSGHLTLMDSCPGGKLYIDDFLTGATAGLSLTNVEDDNYYGPPALASNALKTMAVFVRTEGFEDQEIYFSELDPGSSWSTPVALTSSGRPKVHPDVTAHGDSSFVAVWAENVNPIAPDSVLLDSLYNIAREHEIFTARYNHVTGWQPPERLTSDGYADAAPAIASSNGRLCAVWSYNTGTSYDPTNQRIAYAYNNGAGWTMGELPNQDGYNAQPTVDFYDWSGEAVIVWVHDPAPQDGVSSPSTRELLVTSISSSGIPSGSNYAFLTARGPLNPSIALSPVDQSVVVAYEFWGYQYDSVGAIVDSVVFGDNTRIAASVGTTSGWSVDTIGVVDSTGYGTTPKLTMLGNQVLMAFVGFERDDGVLYDGEIRFTQLNFDNLALGWIAPVTLTSDTIDTYPGDLAVDPTGVVRIQYMLDTDTTSVYPQGYNQIYELTVGQVRSCCEGMRGNAGGDTRGNIDISDLVTLVDFMFSEGDPPLCVKEANVDGSCCATPPSESLTDIDIVDLVYLVDYMFTGGPAPAACP